MNTDRRINEYANSMFMFDSIHRDWILKCADYLKFIFGSDVLRGATVLDYAFGRGNWSLAFIEAGAKEVVAIDASASNVSRFSTYCSKNRIKNIKIQVGNVLETQIDGVFDIVWVYGILHHIEQNLLFMKRMRQILANDCSQILVYSYNSNCLRHRVVTAARRGIVYESYADFELDSQLFNPHARIRARDDLAAPWIDWYSYPQMIDLLTDSGLMVERSVIAFSEFLDKTEAPEFSPHHIVCRRVSAATTSKVNANFDLYDFDHQIIGDLADWIVDRIGNERKIFSIGLFNTHFPALRYCGYAKALEEDFQFLLYCWRKNNLQLPDNPILATYLEAGIYATYGKHRFFSDELLCKSKLAKFIINNPIRL